MVCGKEASTGEIIATSANQIVLLKFPPEVQKRCHQTPFPLGGLKEGLGSRLWYTFLLGGQDGSCYQNQRAACKTTV